MSSASPQPGRPPTTYPPPPPQRSRLPRSPPTSLHPHHRSRQPALSTATLFRRHVTMGPKIGKPTQLMDWITAGIKRGPYMLRIALPFPGHVPSAHRLAWLARRQQAGRPRAGSLLLVAAARHLLGRYGVLPCQRRASKSSCRPPVTPLLRSPPKDLPPGPPGRLPGPYAPQAASQEVGATADGSPLWPRRFPRPASCPFQQQISAAIRMLPLGPEPRRK